MPAKASVLKTAVSANSTTGPTTGLGQAAGMSNAARETRINALKDERLQRLACFDDVTSSGTINDRSLNVLLAHENVNRLA